MPDISIQPYVGNVEPPPDFKGSAQDIPVPPPGFTLKWDGQNFHAIPVPQAQAAAEAPKAEAAPAQEPQQPSLLDRALSPITSYPETYRRKRTESVEQMGSGVEQLKKGEYGKGVANVGLGALGYTFSPVEAGIESFVGKPVQDVTGLPKEYTNFAVGLALPGIGLTKMPGAAEAMTWPGAARRVEEAVSPQTVSPMAEEAAGLIRRHTGEAARASEATAGQLESFYAPASQLPRPEQWNIQNYIDGGKSATVPKTPQIRALVDSLRDALQSRKAQLKSLSEYDQKEFLEDYFPHMWQDPNGAKNVVRGGIGRQGSGASLNQRTIPTFEDGIKAGLKPLYDNPIDGTMRYIMSMDNFIASKKVLEEGMKSGIVTEATPKVVGATGRPGSVTGIPDGYVELHGRGGKGKFAPEAWARVYNNWVSPGFEQFPTGGKIYDAYRRFSNAIMQSLLGFSGYHAFTMAEATMSTDMARAAAAGRSMKPGQLLRSLASYPVGPIRYAYRGKKFKDIYLNKAVNVSQLDKEIVDLLTSAGGRMSGIRHTLDYEASKLGDFLTSFRRAQLKSEFGEQLKQIGQAPITGTAKVALSNLARTIQTFNKPLFQHYIPSIKNGVQGELMADFLKANPMASQTEKLAAARKIVDTVDDRFGEMIQDNIFWNKMFKQTAVVSMLSYSWNMGGMRAIGGGLRDIARASVGRGWTPKADYVVATAINWAILNAMYQKAKTGKWPTETDTPILDLMAGRTGGTDARSGKPERVLVPGIMKDVFGYYEHARQEVVNKLSPGLKAGWQMTTNSDWRGDPIFEPRKEGQSVLDQLPTWLGNIFEFVAKAGTPISFQTAGKREKGSAFTTPENVMGLRTAPRYLTDPHGYDAMMRALEQRRWYGHKGRGGKVGHEQTDKRRYGGPQ